MSNQTSWAEDPDAAKGYRSPINGGNHSLFQNSPRGTYEQKETASWIEPYVVRDHAWSHDQYDMSNQTSWAEDPDAAKGYRSPINGGNHSLFQNSPRGTYEQKETASWIEPYVVRDHAWSHDQYDMSNQTSWAEDPDAAKGYRSPINGGNHSFVQNSPRGTYEQKETASWIEPYVVRDHAWSHDQYDMSNQTSWAEDPDAAKGYRSPINGGNHSLSQADDVHPYRKNAWNDAQYEVSHETQWAADAPKGYRQPVDGKHGLAQEMTMSEALEQYHGKSNREYHYLY